MRFACDTGGTFTDLLVEDDEGGLKMYKSSTTPKDPAQGILDALGAAAKDSGISLEELLSRGEMFIHGTTHAINAIITGNTAKTAFLTTKGHPDILVLREGGRMEPFNQSVPYPEPYVPRALTFEVPERVDSTGRAIIELDEQAVIHIIDDLARVEIEAVAICLLWSIFNGTHEIRIGELLEQHLPGVPYTLSHQLNPALREYRRAASACIDASLKPLMTKYLDGLTERLTAAGFSGRVLLLTSAGGMLDATELAEAPIHAINSGPSMAPIAGRHYGRAESEADNAIVADTGGTTYDVSLVRGGRIPMTRETWLGQPFRGDLTGFPSVDVRSVGAGGGSIAWVDEGGMLHVGPRSAGAEPGPVCYGMGGTEPTVTDASVVLGYIDPDYFLGGTMKLDADAAFQVIEEKVATKLSVGVDEAAAAVISVATENMVQAIADITVNQGIDPASAVLIGGGGAAGLNSVFVARRLNCPTVVIPEVGATLSAAGALMSDLTTEHRATFFTTSEGFDQAGANAVLDGLEAKCREFIDGPGAGSLEQVIEFAVEARYPSQIWEIEVPLGFTRFRSDDDVKTLVRDFHAAHEEIFAIKDPESHIEMVTWSATVRCKVRAGDVGRIDRDAVQEHELAESRAVYFQDAGRVDARLLRFETMAEGESLRGPAIVESPFTTVVVDPRSTFSRTAAGSLVIHP